MADRSPRNNYPPRSRSRSRSPQRNDQSGRMAGTAARWNDRGFGFIRPEDGSEDVFCHFSSITDGNQLREDDRVEFDKIYDDRKGKYRAENVTGGIQGNDRRSMPGPAPGAGVCYDWQKGTCNRGQSCKYVLHSSAHPGSHIITCLFHALGELDTPCHTSPPDLPWKST